MKKRLPVTSWRANHTAAIAPWGERKLVLLSILSRGPGYGWRSPWHWGTPQWRADIERLIKEGLAVRTPKGGPKLCVTRRVAWLRSDGTPVYSHRSNRSRHVKSVVLTDAGRALVPEPQPAPPSTPWAKRKAMLAALKEANL